VSNGLHASAQILPLHQGIPRTTQRRLQAPDGGEEDVQFSGLDFLYGSRIEVGHFGEFFLSQASCHTLTAHIRTESSEFWGGAFLQHAPKGRYLQNAV